MANQQQIEQLLHQYEEDLSDVEDRLRMVAVTLKDALRAQGELSYYYDTRKAELKRMVKVVDIEVAKVRATKYRYYTEQYSRQLTDRAISNYVDFDPDYTSWALLAAATSALYDKYSAASEAVTKRGFALRDLTSALVASIQDTVI